MACDPLKNIIQILWIYSSKSPRRRLGPTRWLTADDGRQALRALQTFCDGFEPCDNKKITWSIERLPKLGQYRAAWDGKVEWLKVIYRILLNMHIGSTYGGFVGVEGLCNVLYLGFVAVLHVLARALKG